MNENLKMSSDERVLFLSIMIQLANLSNYFSDNFMGLYNITAKHIKSTKKNDKEIEKLGELKSAPFLKYLETENIEQAIEYANNCASKVVQRRGVALI